MIGIYKIQFEDKVYIGQSWDIEKRFRFYRILKCKNQRKLYNNLLKYGVDNFSFEIIKQLDLTKEHQDILDWFEVFYIKVYKSLGFDMMNIREGGNGGGKLSDETKQKIRNINLGKKHTEKTKEKFRNKKLSNETKQKISNFMKGENHPFFGKNHTDETKKKISETKKGKESLNKKKVCQIDSYDNIICIFDSITEASIKTNSLRQKICDVCKGKLKTAGGFKWCYVE